MRIFSRSIAAAIVLLIGLSGAAPGQTAALPFGAIGFNSSKPIEITSDSFSVNQSNGTAEFVGHVIVGQGKMRLSAGKIYVEYDSLADQKAGKIARLIASGGVTVVSGGEAVEAKNAVYSIKDSQITLTGNVLLTQGKNAMSGQKAIIDLTDGSAKIEGRVKTIFQAGASK